jgi:limonene-1,2-epoxide hydrolase
LAFPDRAGNYQFEKRLKLLYLQFKNPKHLGFFILAIMSAEKNLSIAHLWFEAFNAHNLEKLLSLYDDDAEHFSPKLKIRHPETNGLITGKEALRTWWQDAFDRLPTLHYKVTSLTSNSDRVFMEYIRTVTNEDDMLVAEVLEVKEGRIIASRVYHG